jgi:cytochrome b561
MEIEKNPGSAWYFDLHKSVGLVIALLVAVRLAWRLTHRAQTLPATVPMWQGKLALAAQVSLYVLMLLVPLTGYLGASYSKAGVRLFGVSTPRWALPNHDISEQIFDIHSALVWVLVTFVVIHALGALKHLLLDKDQVFQRMWFQRRR